MTARVLCILKNTQDCVVVVVVRGGVIRHNIRYRMKGIGSMGRMKEAPGGWCMRRSTLVEQRTLSLPGRLSGGCVSLCFLPYDGGISVMMKHIDQQCRRNVVLKGTASGQGQEEEGREQGSQSDASIQKAVDELMRSDPEKIQRITDAATRVAELQIKQQRLAEEIEGMEDVEARSSRAEEAGAALIAEAEVKAAELLLKAAKLQAESEEARKFLSRRENQQQIDRIESVKAGVFSAAGGCLATLPVSVASGTSNSTFLFNLGVVAICSFLFGVVYRYAVRSDPGNSQLKGGVVGAFGLVRGLSLAQVLLQQGSNGFANFPGVDTIGEAAINMGQSMILFGFCSAILEFASSKSWIEIASVADDTAST